MTSRALTTDVRWPDAGRRQLRRPGSRCPRSSRSTVAGQGAGAHPIRVIGRSQPDRDELGRVEPGRDERGSGTVLMIGVIAVLLVLGSTALVVCGYLIAGHRARAAADLAAFSGASVAARGGDPCAAARRNAHAHGARVVSCDRVGDQIDFVVTVTAAVATTSPLPGLPRELRVTAHAGAQEVS